jgi:hypothetical protein
MVSLAFAGAAAVDSGALVSLLAALLLDDDDEDVASVLESDPQAESVRVNATAATAAPPAFVNVCICSLLSSKQPEPTVGNQKKHAERCAVSETDVAARDIKTTCAYPPSARR